MLAVRKTSRICIGLAAASLLAQTAIAQTTSASASPVFDKSQSAAFLISLGRLGMSTFEVNRTRSDRATPNLSIGEYDAEVVEQDFQRLTADYQNLMRQGAAEAAFVRDFNSAVIDGATLIGTASGVGTIPTLLGRAGAGWANEKVHGYLLERGASDARKLIATELEAWTSSRHDHFQQLVRSGKTEAALAAFDQNTGLLSDMRALLIGDPMGQVIAEGYLLDTLANGTHEAIRLAADANADVDVLHNQFQLFSRGMSEFANRTDRRLTAIENGLQVLAGDITNVHEGVRSLAVMQFETQAQVSAVQSILFNQAPTAQRLAMLEANMVPNLKAKRVTPPSQC